jgi:heme oxygenase
MRTNHSVALGLSLVREVTRDAHARLESSLDLAVWDTSYHRRWTSLLLGLHEPLEAVLDFWWQDVPAMPMVWEPRRRSALLLADLRALGLSEADLHALPRCSVPRPDGLPEVLGQLYVLDGSALGGAVIASAAMAAGVPANACRALTHSGSSLRYWRQTRTSIEGLGAVDSASAARAAGRLFDVFESWFGAATGK